MVLTTHHSAGTDFPNGADLGIAQPTVQILAIQPQRAFELKDRAFRQLAACVIVSVGRKEHTVRIKRAYRILKSFYLR